ncbi:hypothetical protein RhiirB3_492772 [Rhizophagus irregularis]|nr:hypothetical protein RhiirB3_492772 [Rhizophagus irregularis]
MGRWNDQDLDYGTDATAILGQNIAKESDFWVRPRHRPDPPAGSGQGVDGKDKAYPTMMIEVGFSQSLPPDPHQIAALYFNRRTTIQIVLTIKIFGKPFIGVGHSDPNNNNKFPPCNAANLPDYQMNIPRPEIFDGVHIYFPQGFLLYQIHLLQGLLPDLIWISGKFKT